MISIGHRARGDTAGRPLDRSSVPKGWRLILIVGGLSIFGPLCIDMYLPALPRISADLHAGTSVVQLSVTGCLIGMAIGQLFIGPFSDRNGRRSPLLLGMGLFIVSSLVCSVVSSVYLLDGFRFLQGFGGAAGIVIARAIVRDLFEGATAARFFSTLMLVTGLGPMIAPQLGALILRFTSWRGIFVALALAGAALLVTALVKVPETLPPERRHVGGMKTTLRSMKTVVQDRTFVGYAIVASLGFASIFIYIAGSSFVLQGVYGLSAQLFGVVFAVNAAGMVVGAQINGHFVHRFGSGPLLTLGLAFLSAGSLSFVASVMAKGGLEAVLPSLFFCMFGLGFVNPNAMALALQNHPESAGVASAILGSSQFVIGAAVAPLAGIEGNHDAFPMGVLMAAFAAGAIVVRSTLSRGKSPGIVLPESAPVSL